MNATDLSFIVGLGHSPDDYGHAFLRGTPEEATSALEYFEANLRSALLAAALGVFREREAAEDAVQCALYEVFHNRTASANAYANLMARGDREVSPFTFVRAQLYRTLYRRACDLLRKGKRLRATPLAEVEDMTVPTEFSDPLLHKLLTAAIGSLDPEAKMAVASRLAGCETHEETAEFMGASRSVAVAAWRRAIYRLRQARALGLYVASLDASVT